MTACALRRTLLAAALAALFLLPGVPVAQASPISSCSATQGTIIAVDFHHWGGPIVRGCDLKHPAKGINLLTDEGFITAGDQHDGPQFLCRIGNSAYDGGTQYPTPSEDPCVVTPPSSAYWSYWFASAGQNTWNYSHIGAYSEVPTTGEVALWIFGGTNIKGGQSSSVNGFPTCTPNSLRAGGSPSSCTPTSTGHGSPDGGSSSTSTTSARHDNRGAGVHHTSTATASVGGHHAAASHRSGATGSVTADSSDAHTPSRSRPAAAAPAAASTSTDSRQESSSSAPVAVEAKPASNNLSRGSAIPLVLGLCLAALVGLGGGWTVLHRRRHAA